MRSLTHRPVRSPEAAPSDDADRGSPDRAPARRAASHMDAPEVQEPRRPDSKNVYEDIEPLERYGS